MMIMDQLQPHEKHMQTKILKILCFGDSITQGGWPAILERKLTTWKNYRCGVLNKGISGHTTANAFDRLDTDVIPNMPAVLLVEFGVNDCNHRPWAKIPRVGVQEYENNLREFYRIALLHGGSTIFIVNHLLMPLEGKYTVQGNGIHYQKNLEPYNDAVRRIATELNTPIIDFPAQLREKQIDLEKFLNIDGVHLTTYGNEVYAQIVYETLREIYKPDLRG